MSTAGAGRSEDEDETGDWMDSPRRRGKEQIEADKKKRMC